MADIVMKPCHFCGKRIEQPHTYPTYDKGTVYGCLLVHNCSCGIRMELVSNKYYKSKEEALRRFVEVWNGEENDKTRSITDSEADIV